MSASGIMYVMVIAEKGEDSTSTKLPIQLQYIDSKTEDWRLQSEVFNNSKRPLINLKKISTKKEIFQTDHYEYIGTV